MINVIKEMPEKRKQKGCNVNIWQKWLHINMIKSFFSNLKYDA